MNKKLLSVAIAGAMATPMAAQAVKYKLSGQINRAVVFMDDGVQSDVRHEDNIASGTRVRLRGSEDLGNGMKVGFYWEFQTSSNPSNGGGNTGNFPDANSDGNQNTAQIRHANVWFSGNWGRLQIGQGDGAANGAVEADLSGTAVSGTYSGRTSFTAGIRWRTSNGGNLGGLRAGQTFNSFDAFSRYDNIRYDSPALGPVVISGSIGNDNKWEVVGRVNTALAGGQLSGAIFYGENDQGGTFGTGIDSRYGGSVSYLFSQGTNITGHWAENEFEATGAPEGTSWSVKLGHKWGPHAVSIGYGEAEDVPGLTLLGAGVGGANAETEDTGFNIGYVHSLKKANAELYASYFHQELDHNIVGLGSAEDIDVFVVGARVKFN